MEQKKSPINRHIFSHEKYPWTLYNRFLVNEGFCESMEKEFGRLADMPYLAMDKTTLSHKDYTFMFMKLICESSVGLGSDVRKLNQQKSTIGLTKAELLKLWVFLLQYGHLKDTHPAERYVVLLLKDNETLRIEFLKDFPPVAKRFAEDIITRSDWFHFHWILSIWRIINHFPERFKELALLSLQELFLASEHKHGSTSSSCYIAMNVYEKFVYSTLVHSKSSPFKSDVSILLQQLRTEYGILDLLNNQIDPRGALLFHLYTYFVETEYMTSDNAAFHWSILQLCYEKWTNVQRDNLKQIIDYLFENTLREEAHARVHTLIHVYSLPYPASFTPSKLSSSESTKYIHLRAALGHSVYSIFWPNVTPNVEVFFFKERHQPLSSRRIYNSLEAINRQWKKSNNSLFTGLTRSFEKSQVPMIRMLKSLATFLFKVVLNLENVDIRAQLHDQIRKQVLPWSLCFGVDEAILSISSYLSLHNKMDLDKGHRAEPIAVLKGFVQEINHTTSNETFFLIVWGGLSVFGNNKERQIDGMWIAIERAVFRVYLIESKTTKAGPDKCQDLLKEKLISVGVSEETFAIAEPIAVGYLAGGYCFRYPRKPFSENFKSPARSQKQVVHNYGVP
eukprot:TRINITY_DN898_c0_g2_i2.p1 TRINITY_DN898_c0_g2~~TRINITY_DN898_c0_g2_i2.p1  ORF type:complete len:620 (-),score=51.38 TRINITY_DN898_c0_g2_i2:232-2091(-)